MGGGLVLFTGVDDICIYTQGCTVQLYTCIIIIASIFTYISRYQIHDRINIVPESRVRSCAIRYR
jgi:hypothetical protein